jgi:hypothetical protein
LSYNALGGPDLDIFIKRDQLFVENKPFFIQGMNLFLDKFRLETDPRRIYTPTYASDDMIRKIVPLLLDLGINTVRIWPTIIDTKHSASISEEAFHILDDSNIKIILNLPVNWNLKPSYRELRVFLQRYSHQKFENIVINCISNEVYHGFLCPHSYLDNVQRLSKKYSPVPTLVTNANLNFPWYFKSDIIGADFFTYKYSISRDGVEDVGAVAQMYFEDARKLYKWKWFPKAILHYYPFVVKYLKKKARTANFSPGYFRKNMYKLYNQTKKRHKPFLVCEYGYTEHPEHLDHIYQNMPIREMMGHVWYNWINFDENMEGKITNQPLYDKFKIYLKRIKKIKSQ